MADQSKRIMDLPSANTGVGTDQFVIIFNAIENPAVSIGSSARLMSYNDFFKVAIRGPYASDAAAAAANVALKTPYYDNSGTVKIRLV